MVTSAQLLAGYAQGIFPMSESADDPRLYWFDPPRRGILPLDGVHASRSLLRDLRRHPWTAVLDGDFEAVVARCAAREETWINTPLKNLYAELHQAGHAHSLEVRLDGGFAGGIFGVTLGAAFFGESMMSAKTNGSKMALVWMACHLRRCGFTLFDTQFLTPHLQRMGGIEVPRQHYRELLVDALAHEPQIDAEPLPSARQLLQEMTHTS